MNKKLLLGAHTSAQGGVWNALYEGASIGATTVQLFTANQKQWKGKPITEETAEKFQKAKQETGIMTTMSHDSYLINLGCPNEDNLQKSKQAFLEELKRCHALNITYLNFHPGAALKEGEEKCLDTIVTSLLSMEKEILQGETLLLLETTAGQGSCVGWKFEHLRYILDGVAGAFPLGVCMDTCHTFAAGYDLRTKETLSAMLEEFDQVVGLEALKAFHLNDSMKPLASRVDRHAPLGEGEIGWECFFSLMEHETTKYLPKYLETPGGCPLWEKEILRLKESVCES